MTALRKCSEAY